MANQTVVSAAAIWQALFDTLTSEGTELDFTKTGKVFFVDANAGSDSNDGSCWDKSFLTMEWTSSEFAYVFHQERQDVAVQCRHHLK